MVFRRTKVTRSQFRHLPTGARYWLATAVNVAPSIKVSARGKAGAFANGTITRTAITDTSVAVVRVPDAFIG